MSTRLPFPRPHITSRTRLGAALAVIALAIPGLALASSNWSSVGSTGTPDELCTGRVSFNNNDAGLVSGATTLTCTIRYQVHDTWDGTGILGVYLGARFTDNGIYSEVRTRLRAHNTATGVLTTLASLSSNSYAPAATPQTRYLTNCVALNFNANSYFIEADLVRTASPVGAIPGLPVLGQLRLLRCQ
ncbi:hypothetical protein RBA41_18870 [Massilia sp. CCM 9210]|uniref:hypothetical protein n=1 Tax=Massilia scottii TaxID=3057166 RepID=UPI00279654AB|nr:hypothetical protein [Massilia sp. CCM 9210]MDQ1815368.1 hypothetical protein [Massilia sp. CCM 9210]